MSCTEAVQKITPIKEKKREETAVIIIFFSAFTSNNSHQRGIIFSQSILSGNYLLFVCFISFEACADLSLLLLVIKSSPFRH